MRAAPDQIEDLAEGESGFQDPVGIAFQLVVLAFTLVVLTFTVRLLVVSRRTESRGTRAAST